MALANDGPNPDPIQSMSPAITGNARRNSGLRPVERKILQRFLDSTVLILCLAAVGSRAAEPYAGIGLIVSIVVFLVLWLSLAEVFDAYLLRVLHDAFRSAYVAGFVLLVSVAGYILIARFSGGMTPVIRPRISETAVVLSIIVPLALARVISARVLSHHSLRRRVIVVGNGRAAEEMASVIERYGGLGYQLLGQVEDTGSAGESLFPASDHQHISAVEQLARLVHVDQIVLAEHQPTMPLLQSLCLCHERGIQITPMFALYQDLTGRIPINYLGDDWFVALTGRMNGTARLFAVMKRAVDLLLAELLAIVLAPVFALIAVAIHLDSPGPIFLRQVRVGQGGRHFTMYKFRSMYQGAESMSGAVWAQSSDPRVTRVGRLLRRAHLDELPQLWNVAIGDMSFVGPRPERPEFDELLNREIPFYIARRAVRPGITGWAQVHESYGNTLAGITRKVEYDLYYLRHQSPYLDLLILLKTAAMISRLEGT